MWNCSLRRLKASRFCNVFSGSLFSLAVLLLLSTGCRTLKPTTVHRTLRPGPPLVGATTLPTLGSELTAPGMVVTDLSDPQELTTLLNNGDSVLVDFYADWCMPCRQQGAVLEHWSQLPDSRAQVVKVNVDRHADLVRQFQVDGLPTLVLFRNGEVVTRKTGFADEEELNRLLRN